VGHNPKIHEPTDEKIGVSDYVSNDSPHAKTQNERPIGDVAAYAWNITIAWFLVFTAQRYSAVYAVVVCPSVRPTICVSVTFRYWIKTAKLRIMQIMPHDSPITPVFWCQRSWRNSNGINPYGGDKCKWGGLKLATFDGKRAITRKWFKIDA